VRQEAERWADLRRQVLLGNVLPAYRVGTTCGRQHAVATARIHFRFWPSLCNREAWKDALTRRNDLEKSHQADVSGNALACSADINLAVIHHPRGRVMLLPVRAPKNVYDFDKKALGMCG
jgi:hypothetical protein